LHDLHGNAAEWTRTVYQSYPYREGDGRNDVSASGERVVRGGSWYDRPQRATAAFRLAYPSWQRVYNVGFRITCESLPAQMLQAMNVGPAAALSAATAR
jgi:formylglycine-generating enzyme required for sulfatase activity